MQIHLRTTLVKNLGFDDDCVNARKMYRKNKIYHRRTKTPESYKSMVSSSKSYKKMLNYRLCLIHNDVNKKLLNLKSP